MTCFFVVTDIGAVAVRVLEDAGRFTGCSPSSLYAFRGLGSVLPYRSRDVGSTDFDE
ncbi:MAG TPA: hypothetical protein VNO32_63360 [Candidatus Acidoferrum sp.]|nr:hypothetical protein [Candidatus Acidoferrum sp.]